MDRKISIMLLLCLRSAHKNTDLTFHIPFCIKISACCITSASALLKSIVLMSVSTCQSIYKYSGLFFVANLEILKTF